MEREHTTSDRTKETIGRDVERERATERAQREFQSSLERNGFQVEPFGRHWLHGQGHFAQTEIRIQTNP